MNGSVLTTLLPYVLAALLLLALAFLRGWRLYDRRVDRILAIALIFIAAIVAGSTDLGTDVISYREYYGQLSGSGGNYGWWEPGFEQLAVLFASTGAPYGLLVFTCVLASHLIKFYVYDKVTDNALLALFVLFCFNLGEIAFVRQYVAASLILLSFYLLTRHRNTWAVLAMLGAAFFHKTALIAGPVLLVVYFGRRCVKPFALLAVVCVAGALLLPKPILDAIEARVYAQMAVYAVEGYVQGLQAADVSLFRNYAKFLVYVLLAALMVVIPARSEAQVAQRKAAHVVFALSALSVILIAVVSPVFSRLSTFVFPFIALSMRAERFAPVPSQFAAQYVMAGLLGANLIISMYPLLEYL